MTKRIFPGAALCQTFAAGAIIAAIALWPPQRGPMLMVPLTGHVASVIDVAMTGGAGLLAAGPLPGSMIVMGDRAAIGRQAFDRGILVLSAPRALCGDAVSGRAA